MNSMTLFQLTGQLRELDALGDEDVPPEVLRDTLEAVTGELELKATNCAKYALNLAALRDAVKDAADAMKERAARINRRYEGICEYIRMNMEAAGISKIESTELTVSVVKNPPAVSVDAEDLIPMQYMVTPPPAPPPVPRPDKKLIAEAIKSGVIVAGAHLEYGTRLKVKV